MNDICLEAPVAAAPPAAAPPPVYQQHGAITRQLHDTLTGLGVLPQLQKAARGLPDARGRLDYVTQKTGEAADKVLNSIDRAKLEHAWINDATRGIALAIAADPVRAVASGAVMNFVGDVEAATCRIDMHLTDIMMAQDFHDLTGQVMAKVIALASDLEESLVKLLLRSAPAEQAHRAESELDGPAIDAANTPGVVADQSEVDDLLASLGF